MRWRLIDHVVGYEPWQSIRGTKAVSAEEYALLDRLGRNGVFPESLVVAACDELVRWLVAASSEFTTVARLAEVETYVLHSEVTMGQVLDLEARVVERHHHTLAADVEATADGEAMASGFLRFTLSPLVEGVEPEEMAGRWSSMLRRE